MITWGINALNHDSSIAVVSNGELKFWKRNSEYSGIPGDDKLCSEIFRDALNHGAPSEIVWYERPWLKKTRQLYAGQYSSAFTLKDLPKKYLNKAYNFNYAKMSCLPHHLSHAAAGFLTSPFEEATVVVLDAIGEWESASVWTGRGTELTKIWSRSYPTSLGIFYSAFTDLIGFKPLGEEHLLQRLSDSGDPDRFYKEVKRYWRDDWTLRENLHKGVISWPYSFEMPEKDRADIAAATQKVFEEQAQEVMDWAKKLGNSDNLVYMGGCAMNSKFNEKLQDQWQGIWSFPIPGDSASSIGAALYKQKARISWKESLPKHIKVKNAR